MSGPLATWAAEHSKAPAGPRAVLVQLALAARHDGTPALPPTWDDLVRRVARDRATIGRCLAELRRSGEILALASGGGRGRATPYRVVVEFCPPAAGCWSCGILADAQKPSHQRDGFEPAKHTKGRSASRKGRTSGVNRRTRATHNGTETAPTTGGAVPHPESDAALAPDGAAPEPGLSEHTKRAWRAELATATALPTDVDDGERFASLEDEQETKRQRALALLRQDGAA